jgi:hypothetical protein
MLNYLSKGTNLSLPLPISYVVPKFLVLQVAELGSLFVGVYMNAAHAHSCVSLTVLVLVKQNVT